MNTATALSADSTRTRPDADSSTFRPAAGLDDATGVGTADRAVAAPVLVADLDAARPCRARAVVAPMTDAAEYGVVAGDVGGMPPAERLGSSDCGAGGARPGSADLSCVRIRELGPADGDVVDMVFAGLSPRSRYLRFHGPVGELPPAAA
jgi:hypothetical protein